MILWVILGILLWQLVSFVAFLASGQKEDVAIYCGCGLPLLLAMTGFTIYDKGIRKLWCRFMAKRYAAVCVSKGDYDFYYMPYKELDGLKIQDDGTGYFIMLRDNPCYNYRAYRRKWESMPITEREKYRK